MKECTGLVYGFMLIGNFITDLSENLETSIIRTAKELP